MASLTAAVSQARTAFLVLGVTSIVAAAAGCGGAPPTPRPIATVTAPATVAPTPVPTPTADPCADPAAGATFEIHGTEGILSFDLEVDDAGPAATINPTLIEATDPVLGGSRLLRLRVGGEGEPELSEVVADFVPFQASASEPVPASVEGPVASLELPSRDVSGLLRLTASWTTECGPATAGGTIGLVVLDPSIAAGCPTTSDGLQEQVDALRATTLRVGTLQAPIGIVGWSGRWIDAATIDDVPQFAGWDTSISTTVPAGENLPVRDTLGDGIDYLTLRFAFYRRADVVAYLDGSLDEISSVDVVRKNPSETGGVSVPLEFPPGAHVVEIQGTWQTPCLTIDSSTSVSIDRG